MTTSPSPSNSIRQGARATNPIGAATPRPKQYLVARKDQFGPQNVMVLDNDILFQVLNNDPSVTVVRTLAPAFRPANVPPGPLDQVIVAKMSDATADELQKHPQVVLEEDELLRPVLMPLPAPAIPAAIDDPSVFIPFGTSATWAIAIVGPRSEPVVGATVVLYGAGSSAQGTTDATGAVNLSLLNESDATIKSIFVNPRTDYWSLWADRPSLAAGQSNRVTLTALNESFPTFPQQQMLGWGQRLMRMDQIPAGIDGAGVQVAVIDSGAAAKTHPDLLQISHGQDMTVAPAAVDGWDQDIIAHGSHCSGVIGGMNNATGIRGFAPAATIHELRVFPGGRLSSLLDALDYCIDHQIDVVNMSLGGGGSSPLVLEKLSEARQSGVACIVAAGNTGGPVSFPGSSPDVLTVAAMGQLGQFPPNSYHAKQQWTGGPAAGNLFSAQFTCHGPEVDVCAPGVAVVSSVPDRGHAAWDGTSMAAPHVTGLAALVLSSHPDLKGSPRGAARVDRLFALLKASSTPLDVGDSTRTGVGVPDALRALGISDGAAGSTPNRQPTSTGNGHRAGNVNGQPVSIRITIEEIKKQMLAVGLLN